MTVMTIQLQLEDDLVHGIRELAAARGEPEDAVVTQALTSFLGFSALASRPHWSCRRASLAAFKHTIRSLWPGAIDERAVAALIDTRGAGARSRAAVVLIPDEVLNGAKRGVVRS